jgi:hypothetical protein
MAFDRGDGSTGTGQTSILPIEAGGTGANTALTAFSNLSEGNVVVDSSGNVGIGTASSYSQLDVYSAIVSPTLGEATGVGSIRITNGTSALTSAGGLEFKIAGDSNGFGAKIQALNSSGAQLVFANRFGTATWSERMRIDSSGNVGIGTSSPGEKLQVDGNIRQLAANAVIYQSDGTNNAFWGLNPFSVSNSFGASTAQNIPFIVGNNNTERMRIDSSGNVGIGTSSPARKLHVSDVLRLEPRNGAPSSPAKGDIYFDSADDKLKCYDGSVWQDLF